MQVILGSGGAIGKSLVPELKKYTNKIRLVSRNPEHLIGTEELFSADLLNAEEVHAAVSGCEIAYLTVGLAYDYKIWEASWPVIMRNVIEACSASHCKLVFFDNVYMYDPRSIQHMTEENPINPSSKKGKVRAEIANMLSGAWNSGKIKGLIARSADFYGPGVKDASVLSQTVFEPLSQRKKASCLGKVDVPHSYTYVPDAAKATALLGNTPVAYNQVWHLPTAENPPTMLEFIKMAAGHFNVSPKYQTAGKLLVTIIGWFNPLMRELGEMLYQYNQPYVFSSEKFEREFDLRPTPYITGVQTVLKKDYSNAS